MSKTKSSPLPSPPSDWKFLPFRNICLRLIHGGTPSTSIAAYWNGHTPWITGADFENNNITIIRRHITERAIKESSTNIVPKGKILLVSRTGVGKIAIAEFDVAISQDITGLDLDKSEVLDKYIYYALQNEIEEIKKYNQGTSINGILREDLLKHHFYIPSYAEQQSIADILTTLDNLIDHTESLIAKYQSIKQGMMHDLFTRGVDANGRLRPPREEAPELYKESELGWIPKEWEVLKIGDIIDSAIDGPFGSNLKTEHYTDTPGTRVIRLQNIGDQFFCNLDKAYITTIHAKRLEKHIVNQDDILVAALGDDNHPVGRACLFPNLQSAIVKADCFRLKINLYFASNSYMMYQLNTSSVRNRINNHAQGVTRNRINLKHIKNTLIFIPSISEQNNISKYLDQLSNMTETQTDELEQLKAVKSGLMHDLLTGTVRTPQHLTPAQEPPHAV